jgi:putative ATP-dependent endonuclease of OLD family
VRGEIFFARRWVLVEGQCEYLLVRAIGQALDYDLDQHGVAVIDFQNNGNASIYPALADAFNIPWSMVTDGDAEKAKFEAQLNKIGFDATDLKAHTDSLASPNDLEDQLLADGHEPLLRTILVESIGAIASTCTVDDLKKHLKRRKTAYMTRFAPMVAADPKLAKLMPVPFVGLIERLRDNKL